MLSHAVNAGLHDNILVKAEHLKAFLDDVTIASGSKSFILEFFFRPLTSMPVMPSGRMRAYAWTTPVNSSTVKRLFSMSVVGMTSSVHNPYP